MFRVPTSADQPSFDHTEKISFMRWFTSSKAERLEWARRRNAAAKLAADNTNARVADWADRKRAERDGR